MIEVTRSALSGWYTCLCSQCGVETYHENAMGANTEAGRHGRMHVMAREVTHWYDLVGASIQYRIESHFQQLSTS